MLNDFTRVFIRSPETLNVKRQRLLAGNRTSQDGVATRTSSDLESQSLRTSNDDDRSSSNGSTLLDPLSDDEYLEKGFASLHSSSHSSRRPRFDPRIISDLILGLSDGLTVPFALTAGLSTLGNPRVVVFAGLAELTAGAISMGLGGYLGAKSEEESQLATLVETRDEIEQSRSTALDSLDEVFEPYAFPEHLLEKMKAHLATSPHLLPFMMQFKHATMLEDIPDTSSYSSQPRQALPRSRAVTCALTIALGYFLGGFIPLVPYFLVSASDAHQAVMQALWWSVASMAVSLFAFGYGKTCFVSGWTGSRNVWQGIKGGTTMMLVGGLAAGCAMGLVYLFDSFALQGDSPPAA